MKKLVIIMMLLVVCVWPAAAQDVPGIDLFPGDLFTAGVGLDFDFNKTAIATIGLVDFYGIVEFDIGYGGAPGIYDALAVGLDLNTRRLTGDKVRWILDDTDVKLGIYYLADFFDKLDGSQGVKSRGMISLKVSRALNLN